MLSKWCIQYVGKSGRSSSDHRTGKDQSLCQIPRRVLLKNVLTIKQLHSSLMLVRLCLKSCMLGVSIMRIKNFQMTKLDLEKEEKPEIKLPTFAGSYRKLGNSKKKKKNLLLFHQLNQSCMDHNKLWEILKEMGIPDHLTCLVS